MQFGAQSSLSPLLAFSNRDFAFNVGSAAIASCHGPAELLRGDWNIFKYCCNFYVAPWVPSENLKLELVPVLFYALTTEELLWATKKNLANQRIVHPYIHCNCQVS